MSASDYLVNIVLIGLVIHQVHGKRLTVPSLIWPLGLVGWAAYEYLRGIPTAGNDTLLIGAGAAAGAALGAGCGLCTAVYAEEHGVAMAKAGLLAAALWVIGVGSRMAFALYAVHGGEAVIGRFSAAHGITSSEAWTASLILMALAEVVSRTVVLALRLHALPGRQTVSSGLSGPVVPRAPVGGSERGGGSARR